MKTLLTLTLSGSALALLLLLLRRLLPRRMPSTVYYYAWLLVLLRFTLPLPGLIPVGHRAESPAPAVVRMSDTRASDAQPLVFSAPDAQPEGEAMPLPAQSEETPETVTLFPAPSE